MERPANFPDPGGDAIGQIRYNHGSNYMAFKVNNAEMVRFASNNNVGIGTTSPSEKLDVSGAIQSSANEGKIIINSTATNGKEYQLISIDTGNLGLFDGTAYRLWVSGSGSVGIGTTSPSAKLHVAAASGDGLKIITSDVSTIKMGSTTGATSYWGFATTNLAASDFGIYQSNSTGGDPITAGTPRLYFSSIGNIGVGTSSPINGGGNAKWITIDATSANSYSGGIVYSIGGSGKAYHYVENDYLIHQGQSNVGHKFVTNGTTERLRIGSAGQIGIGGANYGTSGQVLTSNGSGSAPSWQNASGSSNWTLSGNDIYNNNSGNVGIGSTSPSTKLHVEGSSIIANSTTIDPDSYTNKVVAGAIADGSGWGITSAIGGNAGAGDSWAIGTNGNNLYMGYGDQTSANSLQTFLQVKGRNVGLVPTSGSVGIGTSSPTSKLHIQNSAGGSGGYLKITDVTYGGDVRFGMADGVNNDVILGSWTNNSILVYTNTAERARITNTGNVGINTTGPAEKLQVIGNIGAGNGTYNGGVYANSSSTAVDTNWGFDFLKTTGQNDYSTRLKYYPVTGETRKAGIWNSRNNDWVLYGDSNNTPNVIIPSGSLRAPIFYDSNNTGYYVDPASTSNINVLTVAGTASTNGGKVVIRDDSIENHVTNGNATIAFNYYGYQTGSTQFRDVAFYNGKQGHIMTIDGSSSSVGIGTTSPGYKLEVNGTAKADEFVSLVNTSNSGITRDWTIIGTGDRGAALQVNDISGAKYAIYAGGYDLTFSKHVSSSNGYTTAMGIYAASATDSSPYVQATHSFRAPIFYDSNNTGYYLNPASTSQIRKTNLIASGSGWDDGLNLYSSDASNRWNLLVDDGAADAFRIAYNNSDRLYFYTTGQVHASSILSSATDMRAPIFYDTDNTGYYIDPASTGIAAYLRGDIEIINEQPLLELNDYTATNTTNLNAWVSFQYNGTEGGYVGFGSAGNSNLYLYNYSGSVLINGSSAETDNSFRAPIFYDSNDTTYYVNPASQSILSTAKFLGVVANGSPVGDATIGRNHAYNTMELKGYGQEMMIGSQGTALHINYRTCNNGVSGHTPTSWYWRAGSSTSYSDHYMGLIQSSSSMRAPIFYDSNDTTYYVDPNSSSIFRDLELRTYGLRMSRSYSHNGIWFNGGTDDNHVLWNDYYGGPNARGAANSGFDGIKWNTYRGIHLKGGLDGAYNIIVAQNLSSSSNNHTVELYAHNVKQFETESGYALATNQMRAPIFYDSNNTGYYVDPAATSVLDRIVVGDGSTSSGGTALRVEDTFTGNNTHRIMEVKADQGTVYAYGAKAARFYNVAYGGGAIEFYRPSQYGPDTNAVAFVTGSTTVGSISMTGSATSYNTTSDYRLKENIIDITDGTERVKQLKPRRFNFIEDPDNTVDGFIAHEADLIVPESVTGEKDEVYPNGEPVYQSMDNAKLVPVLTAALQEAIAKIEDLETRIQILENQ